MNYQTIRRLQIENGYYEMQSLINLGLAWRMEGSVGREAMHLLETGACMLSNTPKKDYYGNYIPSRREVKKGTKGSFQNSVKFYSNLVDNH